MGVGYSRLKGKELSTVGFFYFCVKRRFLEPDFFYKKRIMRQYYRK